MMRKEIARLRFYIGRAWMLAGLWIMPFEAAASVRYNTQFLGDEKA